MTQRAQSSQQPSCASQLTQKKGTRRACLVHTKLVRVFDKSTAPCYCRTREHSVGAGKASSPKYVWGLLLSVSSLPSYYEPTASVHRGVKEHVWYASYSLYLRIIFLARSASLLIPWHWGKTASVTYIVRKLLYEAWRKKGKICMVFFLRQQNNFFLCSV